MPLCEAIRQKNLRATGMNSGGGSNDFAEATAQQVKEVANWLALKIYSDAWEVEERVKVTAACLTFYRQLMSDEARLMTLFGKTPGLEEITYLRKSILDPFMIERSHMSQIAEAEALAS